MQEYTVRTWDKGFYKEMWLKPVRPNEKEILHRLDGPAFTSRDGLEQYWIDDKPYDKEDFEAEIKRRKAPPVKELTVEEISKLLGCEVKAVK